MKRTTHVAIKMEEDRRTAQIKKSNDALAVAAAEKKKLAAKHIFNRSPHEEE